MFAKQLLVTIPILLSTNNINKAEIEKNTRFYTDKGFYIYNENFQVKGEGYFELNNKTIETKGLTILWSNNIQVSSNRAIVEMDHENKIKTISLLTTKEYKPLIIMLNKEGYPNHFSADKITLFLNTKKNEREKISMVGNVETFYFNILEGKAQAITKGKFEKLEPFYDNEGKTWNVNINGARGELVSINYAQEKWKTFILKNFKIYENEVIKRKNDLIRQKEKCMSKYAELENLFNNQNMKTA